MVVLVSSDQIVGRYTVGSPGIVGQPAGILHQLPHQVGHRQDQLLVYVPHRDGGGSSLLEVLLIQRRLVVLDNAQVIQQFAETGSPGPVLVFTVISIYCYIYFRTCSILLK